MALPQFVVVALLLASGRSLYAMTVGGLLFLQVLLMRRFLAAPVERAAWYSGTGVTLYVSGMMVAAFALRQAG
jgi:chlorophyll synthase